MECELLVVGEVGWSLTCFLEQLQLSLEAVAYR